MARNTEISGFKEAFKILDELPNALGRKAINTASRKAAKPIKEEARNIVMSESTGGIFSFFIARGIIVKTNSRRRPPGVAVLVDGPDIPLSGRLFTLWKAARIWAFGAPSVPDRKGHGHFEPFGDFIEEAGNKKNTQAENIFLDNVVPEMDKAGDRLIKRHGKK